MNNIKNVLITGSNGFIGSNLKFHLQENYYKVLEYKSKDSLKKLKSLITKSDFIFHLGGVNKSNKHSDFVKNNVILTKKICQFILENKRIIPIFFSSSVLINKKINSIYSKTKKEAEKVLINNSKKIKVIIARLPNVYGKWAKPKHNSFIATCCYNISRNQPIKIIDEKKKIELIYIDDLISVLLKVLKGVYKKELTIIKIKKKSKVTVRQIYDKISNFEDKRIKGALVCKNKGLDANLYSTYVSFLPKRKFSYFIKTNFSSSGSFTEFIKNKNLGQISILTIKPGSVRGNHYHHSKVEKFLIVSGKAKFEFRDVKDNKKTTILCTGARFKVIETIPGCVHNIKNIDKKKDLIAIIWSNQIYNKKKPDTIFQKV